MTEPTSYPNAPNTPAARHHATPAEVLDFWLGDGVHKEWPTQDLNKRWFSGGAELDTEISERFGSDVEAAVAGGLQDWEQPPLNRLALVILLDQFTRNVFRGKGEAFAGDARAQQLVLQALADGEDLTLPWAGRLFLYMPLMHAESLALQDECVARFVRLQADAPDSLKQRLQSNIDFAHLHRDIIARFGRFPYRNAALGRLDTAEEADFLLKGPRFGQ
ncbi:Uncharacterized conserved protein, DUF924 family [Polaromonas sp. YR568]|uniref:DUF924 family protein n=1 Tax=Polaromonas sp. YR568 TaxID=1855301 RepID=UPI0008E976F1|nr:DUF924 family protein [Polaromonas sp. YR568]SFU38968.1 Uncharacterized conserved protein, DUF924 family [Polaromonas sp. YR568]